MTYRMALMSLLAQCRTALIVLLMSTCVLSPSGATAAGPMKIYIKAGETADLWFGVNVSGTLNYAVRTRDGADSMEMWWIKWGLGTTETLGERAGSGTIEIPIGIFKATLAAKLRGRAKADTVVYISEDSGLAISPLVKFEFP